MTKGRIIWAHEYVDLLEKYGPYTAFKKLMADRGLKSNHPPLVSRAQRGWVACAAGVTHGKRGAKVEVCGFGRTQVAAMEELLKNLLHPDSDGSSIAGRLTFRIPGVLRPILCTVVPDQPMRRGATFSSRPMII